MVLHRRIQQFYIVALCGRIQQFLYVCFGVYFILVVHIYFNEFILVSGV